jgi:hypothetical protein
MSLAELQEYYNEQPGEVSIETLSQCNARCTFCPYPTLERIGTKMPDALLARLIDEMAGFKHPFYFSPFKVNEPLLDKRLIPLCRTFNEKVPHGALRIFSNGSALTEKHIEGVAGLQRVAHLWISLNSHKPAEYEALMGLEWERTAANLDRLHAKPFPHPVMISRVGPDDDFIRYVNWRWPAFGVAIIKRDAWIDFTDASTTEVPDSPCGRWWELNITATGRAALCCMDSVGMHGFGDVNTQTLLEIYNHPTVKAWRDGLLSRKTVGHPCNGCTY